jgi:hypothetical protein
VNSRYGDGENPEDVKFKAFGKKYIDVLSEYRSITNTEEKINSYWILEQSITAARKYFEGMLDTRRLEDIERYILKAKQFILNKGL